MSDCFRPRYFVRNGLGLHLFAKCGLRFGFFIYV